MLFTYTFNRQDALGMSQVPIELFPNYRCEIDSANYLKPLESIQWVSFHLVLVGRCLAYTQSLLCDMKIMLMINNININNNSNMLLIYCDLCNYNVAIIMSNLT